MKIAITGAGGFIGKNLLLGLSSENDILALDRDDSLKDFTQKHRLSRVQVMVCDLSEEESLRRVVREWGEEQEAVVYLAGNGDPAYSVTNPHLDLCDTALGLVNFLRYFRVGRVIYFSSGAVYDGLSGPVSPASSLDPRLPYAISKLAGEQFVKFFQKLGSIGNYIILRFFGAYGPYEPSRKIYSKLVKVFHWEKKREFSIRGDGKNLIDAMFVGDAVRAVKNVLASPVKNVVVDFCSGSPLPLGELVRKAAAVFGIKGVKVIHQGRVPEYITFRPSPEEMKRLFNFSPRVPLSRGLLQLARYLDKSSND